MERHQKADAVAFAEEFLLHPKGILNYDNYDLPTINLINESLSQMVSRFGVKLNAIGTESDIRRYVDKYGSSFLKYGDNPDVNNTLREQAIEEVELAFKSSNGYSAPAACLHDGIFLKQEYWDNRAEIVQKMMTESFVGGRRKYKDIRGILYHEYGHVVDSLFRKRPDSCSYKIIDFQNSLISLLSNGKYSLLKPIKEVTPFFSELLGQWILSENSDCKIEREIWAELFACYYVQHLLGRSDLLPPEIYEKTDEFVGSLLQS